MLTTSIGDYVDKVNARWGILGKARNEPEVETNEDDIGSRNIVIQLRKCITLNGQRPVTFENGDQYQIDPIFARAALKKFESFWRPSERLAFQNKLGASLESFVAALKAK
jgi:hypothetical protein